MPLRTTRRVFLQSSAIATVGLLTGQSSVWSKSPNEKVRLAAVGVAGKGWSDLSGAARYSDIVAFCDVESGKVGRKGGFGEAAAAFPKARHYADWRVMLDKEHKNLDGITVSTPDHMHAPITMTALQYKLGCYTQKPLTRTIYEARRLTTLSREAKVATQMGNQHHNGIPYRTLVQLIQDGVVGKIKEAHAWSNRPIWPQGIDRPSGEDPVPSTLHWDLWLGVAPDRPYLKGVYHPFNWRGWYDFGAGALGDMGCHIIDPVVWALALQAPTTVRYDGPLPKSETFPNYERIHYEFAGTKYTTGPSFRMVWHDGDKTPSANVDGLPPGIKLPKNGTLFVGETGVILTPHGGKALPALYPEEEFQDYPMPKLQRIDHYAQWIDAIRGEGETTSSFAYAGPLTETVLLGTVACRFPNDELHWDPQQLKFTNVPAANNLVHQPYREGWKVDGLDT